MTRLEILEAEYKRALENPLFDNPAEYCVLLDLIQNEIEWEYKENMDMHFEQEKERANG